MNGAEIDAVTAQIDTVLSAARALHDRASPSIDALFLDLASRLAEMSAYSLARSDAFDDVTELMLISSRLAQMSEGLKPNKLVS